MKVSPAIMFSINDSFVRTQFKYLWRKTPNEHLSDNHYFYKLITCFFCLQNKQNVRKKQEDPNFTFVKVLSSTCAPGTLRFLDDVKHDETKENTKKKLFY